MAENTEKTSQHYIGSRLSLVSKMGVRYEGVLYSIDSKESTISLAKEDRPVETPIPPCELVFDYIVFKATDIKDLMVCELPGTEEDRPAGMLRDPAIISCSALPTQPQLDKMVPPRVLIESGGAGGSTLGRQSSPAFYGRGNFGRVPLSEIYRVSPPPPLRAYVPSSSYGGRPNIFPRRPFSVPPPPPPMQLDPVPSGPPTRFESDYDFQTANEKFKEAALDEKSAIDAMLSASKQMTAGDGGLAALRQRCLEEKGEKVPPSGNQSRDEKAREDQHLYYDKTASFFDSISCEDRPKGERNVDWNKERKTNEETFGPAAVRFMDQQNRRNHSNAFVDYGTGGGGGAMFVNRPPPMPPRVRYVPMVYDSPQIAGGARVRRWVAGTRSTAGGGRYRQELYLG